MAANVSTTSPNRRTGLWVLVIVILVLLIVVVPPIVDAIFPDSGTPVTLPPASPGTYRVYVIDWGYHTGIIIQQAPGWTLGSLGAEAAPYVEFAWGDRRYYMDGDHRPSSIFATLFLPTESVAYLDSWTRDPSQGAHAHALYARDVDAADLTRLAEALEGAIRRESAGQRAAPFPTASSPTERFYPAHGHYLWWRDCNRWTVERLAAAHLARRGTGVIFSAQVPGRLLGFHRVD